MVTAREASLEDMMVAMDIVDTLRHRQELVDRELDADARREQLIAKLRDIYQAQGIDVTDATLAQGVDALEKDRFSYQAPPSSFSVFLAKVYISRVRWLKPLLLFVALIVGAFALYYYLVSYPKAQALAKLPDQAIATYSNIQKATQVPAVIAQAKNLATEVGEEVDQGDLKGAEKAYLKLSNMQSQLSQEFQVRIISKPGQYSGVWRIPEVNSNARNYYLIVEAVDGEGKNVSVTVVNEENNQQERVTQWGLRVDQSVFQNVINDKKDDGIIQNNIVGSKPRGVLEPQYKIKTSTKAITKW